MRTTLVLLALLLTGTGTRAQITSERPVSSPTYQPMSGFTPQQIAIASDGDGFLAAWSYGSQVSVTPLASDGSALTPAAIVLATAIDSNGINGVAVAWSHDAYDVFWSENDHRNEYSPRVSLARVAADGRIVAHPRIIATRGTVGGFHSAASNGGHVVLTTSAGYLLLDDPGNVVDSGPFGNATGAMAFATGSTDLTLIDPYGSARIDSGGRLPTLALRKDRTYGAVVACHSDECLVSFKTDFTGSAPLTVARFDQKTSEIGATTDRPTVFGPYDLVAAPEGYLLTTASSVIHFDDAGRWTGSTPFPTLDNWSRVAAASNGRNVLLLLAGKTISTSLVTSSGISQPVVIGRAANQQYSPAIATSGNEYLVAWQEGPSIHARRLSLDGTPLDVDSVLTNNAFYYSSLSAAVDLQGYAVAYDTSENSAEIALIDPNSGGVVSRQTVCGHHIRLAGNPGTLTAAWIDCAGNVVAAGLGMLPVVVARSQDRANGFQADPPINAYPSLAWNGTSWLIMWQEQIPFYWGPEPWKFSYLTTALRGARFSQWLTPIDTKPIAIATAGEATSILDSRVAADGTGFLVAWDLSGGRNEVHARRVSSSGATAGADAVAVRGVLLDMVWDGKQFALAFSSANLRAGAGIAHIRSSGEPLAFETLSVSTTTTDPMSQVSLAPTGYGEVIAAYARFAHEPLYGGSSRVFVDTPRPARVHAAGPEGR